MTILVNDKRIYVFDFISIGSLSSSQISLILVIEFSYLIDGTFKKIYKIYKIRPLHLNVASVALPKVESPVSISLRL